MIRTALRLVGLLRLAGVVLLALMAVPVAVGLAVAVYAASVRAWLELLGFSS